MSGKKNSKLNLVVKSATGKDKRYGNFCVPKWGNCILATASTASSRRQDNGKQVAKI